MSHCSTCPSPEDLFAFQDGVLSVARQGEIAEHLMHCLACRRHLRESEEIGRLLRAHIPLVDDAPGRAKLKARLREPHQPARMPSRFPGTMPYPLLAASLAVLIVLGSSLIWSNELEGGSSFTRWWRDDGAERVVPSGRIEQTPASAPGEVVAPPSLPFDLALTTDSTVDADGYGEWFYRNDEGLAVRVAVDPPGAGWLPVSGDDDRQEIFGFAGHDLVVMYGRDHANVLTVFWIEKESLHTVSVLEQPSDGLSREEVLSIVAVLMDDK